MDQAVIKKLLEMRSRIVANFNAGHWEEFALITGTEDIVNRMIAYSEASIGMTTTIQAMF